MAILHDISAIDYFNISSTFHFLLDFFKGLDVNDWRDQKQKMHLESANRDELKKRVADMKAFLRKQDVQVAEFYEALVRRLIEKVAVYEGRFVVTFRSGVEVEEELDMLHLY